MNGRVLKVDAGGRLNVFIVGTATVNGYHRRPLNIEPDPENLHFDIMVSPPNMSYEHIRLWLRTQYSALSRESAHRYTIGYFSVNRTPKKKKVISRKHKIEYINYEGLVVDLGDVYEQVGLPMLF